MKFKSRVQQDRADCGIACLAAILQYFGEEVSMVHLRKLADTGQEGTSLYGLQQTAKSLGFTAEGVRIDEQYLDQLNTPVIAHCQLSATHSYDHYVVITEVRQSSLRIMDPAIGKLRKVSKRKFRQYWDGVILLLEKTGEMDNSRYVHDEKEWDEFHMLAFYRRWSIFLVVATLLGLVHYLNFVSTYLDARKSVICFLLSSLIILIEILFLFKQWNYLRFLFRKEMKETKRLMKSVFRLPQELLTSWSLQELSTRFEDIQLCFHYLWYRDWVIPKNCSLLLIVYYLNYLLVPIDLLLLIGLSVLGSLAIHSYEGFSKRNRSHHRDVTEALSSVVSINFRDTYNSHWRLFLNHMFGIEDRAFGYSKTYLMTRLSRFITGLLSLGLIIVITRYLESGLAKIFPQLILLLYASVLCKEILTYYSRKKSYTNHWKRWQDLRNYRTSF